MTAWLLKYGGWLLAVLGLLAAGYLGWSLSQARSLKAQQDAQVARLTGQVNVLARELDSASQVVQHDSVVLVRVQTQYVIHRDTLLLHKTDTVLVTRFIQTADSTIHACTVLVTDCEQRANLLQRQLLVTDSLNKVYARMGPSWLERAEWPLVAVTFVAGALVGHALAK